MGGNFGANSGTSVHCRWTSYKWNDGVAAADQTVDNLDTRASTVVVETTGSHTGPTEVVCPTPEEFGFNTKAFVQVAVVKTAQMATVKKHWTEEEIATHMEKECYSDATATSVAAPFSYDCPHCLLEDTIGCSFDSDCPDEDTCVLAGCGALAGGDDGMSATQTGVIVIGVLVILVVLGTLAVTVKKSIQEARDPDPEYLKVVPIGAEDEGEDGAKGTKVQEAAAVTVQKHVRGNLERKKSKKKAEEKKKKKKKKKEDGDSKDE